MSEFLKELERREIERQNHSLNLIASENYAWPEVLNALASMFGNKYAEGTPGKRFYAGCQLVDELENYAQSLACKVFSAQYANLQPHSGSCANQIALRALLEPDDTVLAMSMQAGGHLTHGHAKNLNAKLYHFVHYQVDQATGLLDFAEIENLAQIHRPKLIIAGASAYARQIDFALFAKIARSVDAFLLADIAHIAGLVAAKLHPSPVGHADVITMTSQKTLRGPRGGLILSRLELGHKISQAVMPGVQGGPHCNSIFAKAVMLEKALTPEFITYQQKTLANAQALAKSLQQKGLKLVSGGTDNHLLLIDLVASNLPLSGKQAATTLENIGIIANANLIPFDQQGPLATSGLRLGTPALTARGLTQLQAQQIGQIVVQALQNTESTTALSAQVQELTKQLKTV